MPLLMHEHRVRKYDSRPQTRGIVMMLVLFAIGTSLLAVASTADSAAAVTQRADHERSDHELYGWNTNHGREKRQEGNSTTNLVPCPCNSSENCFSFEDDNGTEICSCISGYELQMTNQNGQVCTDVDECISSSHDCGTGICINTPGSYICVCPPGYVFNIDSRQCVTVDYSSVIIPPGFLPFGPDYGDSRVPTRDDGSTEEIQLGTDIIILGSRQNKLYVSTNGVLSFGQPFTFYSSFGANFDSIRIPSPPLIAPFWDDVDIRNGGTIYYRQDNTLSIAQQIQQDISLQFHNISLFHPSLVFIATWDRVAPFGFLRDPLLNTFQVVVASDGTRTFVRFNYGDIQWGGFSTLIGVSIGDRANFITHPASLNQSVLSLDNSTTTYFEVGFLIDIRFTPSIYTVSEDDRFVNLTIVKNIIDAESATEIITVHFSTSDLTAKASEDYNSTSLSVTFDPGESEMSVQVPIINDLLREESETFYGNLMFYYQSELLQQVQLTGVTASIEILYNDCNCDCANGSCSCHNGYFGNGFICLDDDECEIGLHERDCDINANCVNTIGSFECTCNDGFLGDGKTCISNSTTNLVPCPCNSSENCFTFEDDNGNEICGCKPGYELRMSNQSAQTCTDIDECNSNSYDCANGTCVNVQGSYICICPSGYTFNLDNQQCIDVDECSSSYDCGNGTCANMPGSYICNCPPGYIFNLDERQCTDVDECKTNIHHCDENANCFNTEGSYDCTCHDGFIGNGITCLNNSNCELLNCSQLCTNTTGSLICTCHPGYYLNTLNLRECEDLDECDLRLDSCDINAECKNNINGSYECRCNSGYRGNGWICNDIDECETGLSNCTHSENCRNLNGTFECGSAPIIMTMKPEQPNHNLYYSVGNDFCLERVDSLFSNITLECSLDRPDPSVVFSFNISVVFENVQFNVTRILLQEELTIDDGIFELSDVLRSLGLPRELAIIMDIFFNDIDDIYSTIITSVICVASNGFGEDDATSSHISVCGPTECQDGVTNNCTQTCTRTISNETSSYECGCNKGYELDSDNTTCIDINECQSLENRCSDNEDCMNNEGGYSCPCKPGYKKLTDDLNEKCTEIKDFIECKTYHSDRMNCHMNTTDSCVCTCKEGYYPNMEFADDQECEDVNECMSYPCHPNATCTNTNGTYDCMCDAGYEGDGRNCNEMIIMEGPQAPTIPPVNSATTPPSISSINSRPVSLDTVVLSSTIGAVAFLLLIAVLVLIICFFRKYFTNIKKKNDLLFHNTTFDQYDGSPRELNRDFFPRTISVQSSYKLNLPQHLLIPASDIKLVEPIGQGEFGIVYKGYIIKKQGNIVTDTVAVKTLKGMYNRTMVREMLKECSKMYNFNHPNVLTLRGVCLDGGTAPYIIMPFMANGSLLAYLKKNRETLIVSLSHKDEDDVTPIRKRLMDMCIQVAKGMEYLASKKVVHRDLAARNCMIDMNFVIKVADFGLAESVETREYFRQDKSSHIKLPLRWLAPESMEDYVFSEKSDVWAYGVTCWEIFSGGKVPYGGVTITDLSRLLADGHRLEKPNNDACSDQLYQLLLQCWEFERVDRPQFADIVSALSESLGAMAGYLDIGAFSGETTVVEINECSRETLELVEEQSLPQASSEGKCQADKATVSDESTV